MIRTKLVAILAPNPALTSILAQALRSEAGLKVCEFESGEALVTFMRISPLDLVVIDVDSNEAWALDFVRALRSNRRLANPQFDVLALTRAGAERHQPLRDAGVDEVLTKPVSTAALLESADFWLVHNQRRHGLTSYRGPERRSRRPRLSAISASGRSRSAEIIELFGPRPRRA